jgi:hypothetical protein
MGFLRDILGDWEIDAIHVVEFGNVVLRVNQDGEPFYIIRTPDRDQVAVMTYQIEGGALITDQESSPRQESTPFRISVDTLELFTGSAVVKYHRLR